MIPQKNIEMYYGIIRVENKILEDYTKGSNFIILIPDSNYEIHLRKYMYCYIF